MTNAFELEIWYYNGHDLLRYATNPTTFFQVIIGLDTERLSLPEYIELAVTGTAALTIVAKPGFAESVEDTVQAILKESGRDEIINALADNLDELYVQSIFKAQLAGSILFSQTPVVGVLMPDFEINLGEANMFMHMGLGEEMITMDNNEESGKFLVPFVLGVCCWSI